MQAKALALLCAEYALEKKAQDLRLLEIGSISSLADYLLIVTGTSDRHVKAVTDAIRLGLKKDHGAAPLATEGADEGRWALLDFGDVMIHVFQPQVRSFYDLEGLWSEAEEITIPEPPEGLTADTR